MRIVNGSLRLNCGGFEVLDEVEEDVDVDRFGDEGEIAGREGALTIVFARVAGNRDGWNIAETGKDPKLFQELVSVDVRHAYIRDNDVRTLVDCTRQRFGG